jgi:hypothetical protein
MHRKTKQREAVMKVPCPNNELPMICGKGAMLCTQEAMGKRRRKYVMTSNMCNEANAGALLRSPS